MYQAKLQSALTTSQNFKDGLDAAIKSLNELKKQLDKLPLVSRNLNELRNQAQQFKVSLSYLADLARERESPVAKSAYPLATYCVIERERSCQPKVGVKRMCHAIKSYCEDVQMYWVIEAWQ